MSAYSDIEPNYYNSTCFVYDRIKILRGKPFIQYLVLWRKNGLPEKEVGAYPTKTWAIAVADKIERKRNER